MKNELEGMTWDEFQDLMREAIEQGWAIATLEPGGNDLRYTHVEHATVQQLRDRLTLNEVETFWSRHIYTPRA